MLNKKQSGATLIVALVLLVVVTLFGIASMRGTTLEMKMVASARDRTMAFEAAESTLKLVERDLLKTPPTLSQIRSFTANCSATEESGKKGYCFGGSFDADEPYKTCKVVPDGTVVTTGLWEIEDNWKDGGNFVTADIAVADPASGTTPKKVTTQYFVEFMCFTLKEKGLNATLDDKENDDGSLIYMPMYRVTALAEGLGQRSKVMSQSMVKVELGVIN